MRYVRLLLLSALCNISVLGITFNKLSVLTKPIGYGAEKGHPGVRKSLLAGLSKNQQLFNYNPTCLDECGDAVHVLADINALRQAIRLKQQGKIKYLLAGPTLMVRGNEYNHVLGSKEIDICILNSDWIQQAYEYDEPALRGKIILWPAGVNTDFWKPRAHTQSKNVLIYWKTEGKDFCNAVKETLKKYGWNPVVLKYGNYCPNEYKQFLDESAFAVFIGSSESQGIALAESWAMDVPTLVWNPGKRLIAGRMHDPVSAAPYLTSYTGAFWKEMHELEYLLEHIDDVLCPCAPREWMLENMTNEITVQRLLQDIQEYQL